MPDRVPKVDVVQRDEPDLLNPERLPTGTLMDDIGCPHCGKTCDVCVILDEERHQLRGAVEALRMIFDYAYGASGVTGDDAGHLTTVGTMAKDALIAVERQP